MARVSPTIEGFRVAFRQPSLTFAEIAWRWTLGFTAAALFVFYCVEYLDTLHVTNGDSALLSTRQPALVERGLANILRGSLTRSVLAALLVALALAVLWSLVASVGRLAIVRALLAYFRRDVVCDVSAKISGVEKARPIRTLIDLNCLRVAVVLAMMLAIFGSAIFAGFVSTKSNPRPGLAFILFVLLAGLACMAGWTLNWWLSLAGIFAVRDAKDALDALSSAVAFSRDRTGSVFAVSIWTGLAHLGAYSIATTPISLTLALFQLVPSRLVIVIVIFLMLAYFAVADWLYMARLGGYVCIAEMPDALLMPPLSPTSVAQVETGIDRDEPILSDLPNLAVEM